MIRFERNLGKALLSNGTFPSGSLECQDRERPFRRGPGRLRQDRCPLSLCQPKMPSVPISVWPQREQCKWLKNPHSSRPTSLFYGWGNGSPKKLSDVPQATQYYSSRAKATRTFIHCPFHSVELRPSPHRLFISLTEIHPLGSRCCISSSSHQCQMVLGSMIY